MAFQARFVSGDPVSIDHTPSGADVEAGDVVVIGDVPAIARLKIVDGELGALDVGGGVYEVTPSGTISKGAKVYWDDTNNKVTATASGNKAFGWAAEDLADLVKGECIHNPGA